MRQLTPPRRRFLALEPSDGRKGREGLAAVCRPALADNPGDGAVSGFRPRAGPTRKLLAYEGPGGWLCTTRRSQGRFPWGPPAPTPSGRLCARELTVLLGNGFPARAQMAPGWRQVAEVRTGAGGEFHGRQAPG
jgi:IS66 Orf2 like protein